MLSLQWSSMLVMIVQRLVLVWHLVVTVCGISVTDCSVSRGGWLSEGALGVVAAVLVVIVPAGWTHVIWCFVVVLLAAGHSHFRALSSRVIATIADHNDCSDHDTDNQSSDNDCCDDYLC